MITPTHSFAKNDIGHDPSLVDWWRHQCERNVDRLAVVTEDRGWKYGELDRLIDSFADSLLRQNCQPGTRIGLCVDRSAEAIAAMMAVMKIGAAFVPLDPEYPVNRLADMVQDAAIDVIIGHANYENDLGPYLWQQRPATGTWIQCETIVEQAQRFDDIDAISGSDDDRRRETAAEDSARSNGTPNAGDLAYLMYTSGSTGKPKGVKISHRALVAYCRADIECYQLTPEDRTLQFSTLCFDIAIEEIFPPLLSGGCVVVRPRGRADQRNELSSLIDRFDITAIHLATAYWHSWVDLMVASNERVPSSLRLVIATGEKVSLEHYRRWNSISDHDMLWCNAYGPTETTVTATVFIPDANFDRDAKSTNMPIGKPLPGYDAYILDENRCVIEDQRSGELCIGGPALADGYHNRPEQTDAVFIEAMIDGQPRRLYRTGDVARWLPDGNIDFGGRFDHQIKLGSYRIEPGEIEAAIDKLDGVLESLVSYDEVDGKKFLVAYIARGASTVTAGKLATDLRQTLPPYMIPARYVLLEEFPKTINGKIDRDALPDAATGDVPQSVDHAGPRDELEQTLVDLWREVLNLPEIGIHDDFFLLGGSSLLVMQIVTRLTLDMSIELPVRDFFANPTIATSARQIRKLIAAENGGKDDSPHDDDAKQIRVRLPILAPAFFPSGDHRLFSVRYQPPAGHGLALPEKRGIVIAHSLGHEYTRGYRNLQQLAVQLAQQGFEVLRFDYAGTGNSTGSADETTASIMRQNLIDARDHLADVSGINDVAVIGLRLGATLASNLPAGTFSQTILWDPIESGSDFLRLLENFHRLELSGLTRFNRHRRAAADVDQLYGYRWSQEKRDSIAALTLCRDRDHQHVSTDDEIRWEDHRFNEAAFSSPKSFAAIANALNVQSNHPSSQGVGQ